MRLLVAWMALVVGAVIGGALLAPWIHGTLVGLGRNHEALVWLRDVPFERLLSRCVQLLLVLGLVPALRWSRVRGRDLGLVSLRAGTRGLLAYFAVGVAMIAAVVVPGIRMGAYLPNPAPGVGAAVAFLPAALLIGFFEEFLFRGVVLRSLRATGGLSVGVILSSLLFSAVHFASPEPTIGVAHAHWYSGLQLIPDTFRWVHAGYHYFPIMLNLFLMGVALCLVVERSGNLYGAIGLHAGWVWALRAGNQLLQRDTDRWGPVFGWDNRLATGYAATVIMALLVVFLWNLPARPNRGST